MRGREPRSPTTTDQRYLISYTFIKVLMFRMSIRTQKPLSFFCGPKRRQRCSETGRISPSVSTCDSALYHWECLSHQHVHSLPVLPGDYFGNQQQYNDRNPSAWKNPTDPNPLCRGKSLSNSVMISTFLCRIVRI